METIRELNNVELQKLSKVFRDLESYTLKSMGYNKVSGGYAVANHFDYDDDIIDVTVCRIAFYYIINDDDISLIIILYRYCRLN
jgi:hypothetical protein